MDNKKTYEGMFILDSGNPDFETAGEPVRAVLGRSNAEILSLKPWDERRLAYPISGRKRGLYALAYFKADPSVIGELEHDCLLDERILRAMILRKDTLSEEQINAETPATDSARRAAEREAAREERERLEGEADTDDDADNSDDTDTDDADGGDDARD